MPTDPKQPSWIDYFFDLVPTRFRSGYAGAFTYVHGLIADACEAVHLDSLLFRHVKEPESPDDVLGELGQETGIPRYLGETADSHRQRIVNKWQTLPYYGTEAAIRQEVENVLGGTCPVTVVTWLPGSGFVVPSHSGDPSLDIPAYPPSSVWPSQFIVIVDVSAEAVSFGTESALLNDAQLSAVRSMIRFVKPVDWVCREIVLRHDALGTQNLYDDGHVYDGSITYGSPSIFLSHERHRGFVP